MPKPHFIAVVLFLFGVGKVESQPTSSSDTHPSLPESAECKRHTRKLDANAVVTSVTFLNKKATRLHTAEAATKTPKMRISSLCPAGGKRGQRPQRGIAVRYADPRRVGSLPDAPDSPNG
jgi:hypothetical protein